MYPCQSFKAEVSRSCVKQAILVPAGTLKLHDKPVERKFGRSKASHAPMSERLKNSNDPKTSGELAERLMDKGFQPSEFMRARHPELFSDSRMSSEPSLSKEVFEYHLDSLTSRKQELEFEHSAGSSQNGNCALISFPKLDPQVEATVRRTQKLTLFHL